MQQQKNENVLLWALRVLKEEKGFSNLELIIMFAGICFVGAMLGLGSR